MVSINTNISAILTTRVLNDNSTKRDELSNILSTAMKVNHAKDDAAAISMIETMLSETKGMQVAMENIQIADCMMAIEESGLASISNDLQSIRELTLQAANGTNSEADKAAIMAEINQLTENINTTAKSTSFNGINLLDGSITDLSIQAGANFSDSIDISEASMNAQVAPTADGASEGLNIALISSGDVTGGLVANTPYTPANFTKGEISSFLKRIDSAISTVTQQRATVGNIQNKNETQLQNLAVASTNLMSAGSSIQDADMAKATSSFILNNILEQSSQAMLIQINQAQSNVINLLMPQNKK